MDVNMSTTQQGLNFSSSDIFTQCFTFPSVTLLFSTFCVANLLLVGPLYVSVLYLGFRQQRRCCLLATSTTRHSDVNTYNLVAMGMIEALTVQLFLAGEYIPVSELVVLGMCFFSVCWFVKLQFHVLACIDCYLAVVHPVTYFRLKSETGSRIRTVVLAWVWLQLLVWVVSAHHLSDADMIILLPCHLVSAFAVIFYCGVSVLWALKRPAPGRASRDGERVHQTKRRAFFTISTILCVVLFTLVWVLICNFLVNYSLMEVRDKCLMAGFVPWFCLPCNTVMPLLYLHRMRKHSKRSQKSG